MRIQQIKTQIEFETLASLSENNRKERSHYEAPFYVYYASLRNLFINNANYLWFLFIDEDKPVGYFILTTDSIRNSIVVYDIYTIPTHRNKGAFNLLFNYLYDICKLTGKANVTWDSELPPDTWNRILKTIPKVQYYYTINHQTWRDSNG